MRNERQAAVAPLALTEAEVLAQLPALRYVLEAHEPVAVPRLWRTPLLPPGGEHGR